MYYPAGQDMWRNNQISSIPKFLQNGTKVGWENLTNLTVPFGYEITALVVSQNNPLHVLYYGASHPIGAPLIFKLIKSDTSRSASIDISVPGSQVGAYAHNISVNPQYGNEIIVTYSNYNVVGLYHSSDGGLTYDAIEGNLTGTMENSGPSLRASSIVSNQGTTLYILGTSVGVYSTLILNGNSTVWEQEGEAVMGNVVVGNIASRDSDGRVVIGTHGRGIFIGDMNVVSVASESNIIPERFKLNGNYPNPFNPSTTIEYVLSTKSNITITVYNLRGQEVTRLLSQAQEAGTHKVIWNASGMASGVYFYRLQAGDFVQTRKMVLLK